VNRTVLIIIGAFGVLGFCFVALVGTPTGRHSVANWLYHNAVTLYPPKEGSSHREFAAHEHILKQMRAVVALNPDHKDAWTELCRESYSFEKPGPEVACAHQIRLNPTYEAYMGLGDAVMGKDKRVAMNSYEQAAKLKPDQPEPLASMAEVKRSENQLQETLALLKRAELVPGYAKAPGSVCKGYVRAYLAMGKKTDAENKLQCWLSSDYQNGTAHEYAGYFHELRGNKEAAQKEYEEAGDVEDDEKQSCQLKKDDPGDLECDFIEEKPVATPATPNKGGGKK
jgi:tetratricopeptide (TPR) repeat protein